MAKSNQNIVMDATDQARQKLRDAENAVTRPVTVLPLITEGAGDPTSPVELATLKTYTVNVPQGKPKSYKLSTFPGLSGTPRVPEAVSFKLFDQKFELYRGVYPASAGTGGGKSLTMSALALALTGLGAATIVYAYIYEDGAPSYGSSSGGGSTLSSLEKLDAASIEEPFTNPEKFIENLIVQAARANLPKNARVIFILDAINDAIINYRLKERSGQPTYKEGAQPMDLRFLKALSDECYKRNWTIIGVINPDVIPVTKRLEATVQGVISILDVGLFSKQERGSGRVPETYRLPEDLIRAAAQVLHYPERKQNSSSFSLWYQGSN
jgi:hypothetical protein